jgi:hypothetical protein
MHKPEIVSQAYVDRIHAELEILQMVMAEIYDICRRKDLAKKRREGALKAFGREQPT